MIEVVRLHHVSFAVADLRASRDFFGGVLGLPEIERPDFGFAGAWYSIGDRQLHLIEQSAPGGRTDGRISRSDHVAIEVESVAAVRERLRESGVAFEEGGNQALGMEQVFCGDPDGHTIEFVRYSS